MENKPTFPRTITIIDEDIELFDVEVTSPDDIRNEITWAASFNRERTNVWASDDEYNYSVKDGLLITEKK
jgi:hypothetical protein